MPSLPGKLNPSYKHGYAKRGKRPAVYWRWRSMLARCHNPKDQDYPNYGGRGITVCDAWRFGRDGISGFEAWLADMGQRPGKRASIGRKENDKGYTPENCRWESQRQQANNKRTNVYVTYAGRTQTIAQWAEEMGLSRQALRYRLKAGATIEAALFTTPNHGNKLTKETP